MSKGSWIRPYDHGKFSDNYEAIFRKPVQDAAVEGVEGEAVKQEPHVSVSQLQRTEARG